MITLFWPSRCRFVKAALTITLSFGDWNLFALDPIYVRERHNASNYKVIWIILMAGDEKKDPKLGQCEPPDRLAGGERFDYLARCAKDLGFSDDELKELEELYGQPMENGKS